MICNVKSEKQRKLRRLIARDIMDLLGGAPPFDLQSYVQSIYNTIHDMTNDHAKAVDYARLTPFFIDQILSSDTELLRGIMAKGLDRNSLTDLILSVDDPNTGVEFMENYLGLQEQIKEELRELNEPEQKEEPSVEDKEPAPVVEGTKTPSNRVEPPAIDARDKTVATGTKDFERSPSTMQADVSFESPQELPYQVPSDDPEVQFYFKVKRKIVQMLAEADYDSTNLNLPGYGAVYLTAMAATSIPDEYLRPDTDLNQPLVKQAHETGIVLALTTSDGALIHFNKETGEPGDFFSEDTKPAYYYVRRSSDFANEKQQKSFEDYQRKVTNALAHKLKKGKVPTGTDISAARAIIEKETKLMDDIRQHILEDKSRQIRTAITGGTMGHTKFDYVNINTELKDVNFDGEVFDPKQPTAEQVEQGLFPGRYYFTLESMYGRPIEIERARVKDSGLKETVIGLLTDDLVYEDSKGNIVPADFQQRRDWIKAYLNTSKDTIQILSNSAGGHKLRILGKEYEVRTPEQRDAVRTILERYFSNLVPTRQISSPKGRKVVKAGDTAKYTLGAVIEVEVPEGKNRYYVLEYAKHNIDQSAMVSNEYTSIDEMIPQEDGTVLLKTSKQKYKDHYIRQNFSIHYELNADNKLVRLDPYFTFSPLQEDLNSIYNTEETMEKEIEETLNESPEVSDISDEGPADMSADDILKQNWDDPEMQKNLDVKGGEKRATEKQIADAKTWYENSPLAQYFPFQAMFNAMNSTGAAATWTINGITLFKGADYSDLYHEAWHGFTQAFLTVEQKQSLYDETRKKQGSFTDYTGKTVQFSKATNLQLEEYLAEDFRKYMLNGQKAQKKSPKRNNIFRKIYNFLRSLFKGMSVSQVVANDRSNETINELYEKLRVGNLTEYNFSQDNVTYGQLNAGIQPYGKENRFDDPLLYEDSMLIVETVDSLISEYIDRSNSGLTSEQKKELSDLETRAKSNRITPEERETMMARISALRDKQTYTFTSKQMKTVEGRQRAYFYAKFRMGEIHRELVKDYEASENEVEKSKIKRKIDLLTYALRNFGDVKNLHKNRPDEESGDIDGVIAYHALKSKILEKQDVEEIFVEPKEETFVQARDGVNRKGNDNSAEDLASTEILTILHTLYQYDTDGNVEVNKLGVPKIAPFREVWNRLLRMLSGLEAHEMERVMQEQAEDYPPIKHLLQKLGPLATASTTEDRLWTSFWRTFNLTKEPLTQTTFDTVDGEYISRIGDATGEFRKVGRDWESDFKSDHNNPYTKVDENGVLYLDIPKVLKDFPAKNLSQNRFEFFQAIGFKLSDKTEIREALSKRNLGGANYYRERLENLAKRGEKITNFADLNREYKTRKIGDQNIKSLADQTTRFKELQELEQKYSDKYASTMVSTASGNSQSEYTLNSTLTQVVNKLNKSRDKKMKDGTRVNAYQALIMRPEMAHFNIDRNPILKGSTMMNSLFVLDVDKTSPEYGMRRRVSDKADAPFVEIKLANLSGVLLQEDSKTVAQGTDTADMDPHTKLISDLHLMVQNSSPELIRHGDKGTYHSATLNKVYAGGKPRDMYVDTVDFLRGSYAHDQATDILIKHISAEQERIRIMNNPAEYGLDTNFDQDYVQRGKDFVAFDKMLSDETKDKIKALTLNLDDYIKEGSPDALRLKQEISQDIADYFEAQYESIAERFAEAEFISDSLMKKISGQAANVKGTEVSDSEVKEAMLKSLLYNTWIHNIESMAMFYGDIAQYKVAKGDLHKRVSGIASTGLLSRTDESKKDFINKTMTRDYAKKLGVKEPKAFDGTFDTAVIKDKTTKSAYIEELTETLGEEGVGEYAGFNEADAMGLISFDSYRILKNAQGQWYPQHELMYQEIVNGKTVDPQKVKDIFFPTIKAQYFGPLQTEMMALTAFHKYELFPLIPTVIEGAPKMKALHDKMTREGIDYVVFESGSKVATITKDGTPDNWYNEKRELNTEEPFTKNTIFLDYLKDQLEIAPKFKGKVTFPTQLRTLIEESMFENGLPVDFMSDKKLSDRQKAWNGMSNQERAAESPRFKLIKTFEVYVDRVTQIKKRQLLEKANATIDNKGKITGNIDDLVKFLKRELDRLDMADHEINFLATHNGKMKHDLSMALFADKLERTLQAIVTKELINQQLTGEALIQVSGAMFESPDSMVERDYDVATEEDRKKWGSNDLPFYTKKADGTTAAAKVKIALQGEFKKLLQMEDVLYEPQADEAQLIGGVRKIGTIERLNELIKDERWLEMGDNRRMITMVSVRIPIDDVNLMEFFEVYEFLPETAGNIIVPPAEIVAKSGSDYDIDKLTTLMPSFEIRDGKTRLKKTYTTKSKEAKELYDNYKKAAVEREKLKDSEGNAVTLNELRDYRLAEYTEDTDRQFEIRQVYNNLIESFFGVSMEEIDEHVEEILLEAKEIDTFEEFVDKLNGLKAAENDLLWSIKGILESPYMYEHLVRPNDTTQAKTLSRKYAKEVYGKDREAPKSGSNVLGYEFNLDTHYSNSAGKRALGITAVGNKWNSLFNRVGMRLNPTAGISEERKQVLEDRRKAGKRLTKSEYNQLKSYRRQVLLLPHHQVDGGISLGEIMDVNGENRISTILSQIMNGQLDIAKDDWVFDIQGTEEIIPTMEFMLEAGVPFETAVTMTSIPLVREYIQEVQLHSSGIARALDKSVPENQINNAAKVAILTDPKYGFNLNVTRNDVDYELSLVAPEIISEALKEDNFFDADKLYKMSTAHKKAMDQGKKAKYGPYQQAAFLHFLEIENMAKAMKDIKLRLNVDTNRTGTFFEIQNKIALKELLLQDSRFPASIVKRITEASPISSFFIQEFQQEIYKDMFLIRDHELIRDFLQNNVDNNDVKTTFGKKDIFANEFRNDLMNYIFQNSVGTFDLASLDSYRGLTIEGKIPVKEVNNLTYGAFVKEGVMYVDKQSLYDQVQNKEYAQAEGLASVPAEAFKSDKEYYKFVLEREYLRYALPYAKVKDTIEYQRKYDQEIDNIERIENETDEQYEKRANKEIYDIFLRDKALNNVNNMWKTFQSEDTYADEFRFIRDTFPELQEEFAIIKQLGISATDEYTNLKLNDSSLKGDLINLYHENLERLAKPGVKKVDDPQANQYISEFFGRFATVAFLQSGQNTKSAFSMVRVVPQDKIIAMVTEATKKYKEHFDRAVGSGRQAPILQDFYNEFVRNNTDRAGRIRGKNYSSNMTLSRSIKMLNAKETLEKEEVFDPIEPRTKEEILAETKTEVEIVTGTNNTKAAARAGEGVYVMRVKKGDDLPMINENQHFGNPWSHAGYEGTIKTPDIKTAVKNYKDWLDGKAHLEVEPVRREWILNQITQGQLTGKKLLYFKSGYKSHADVLADLVNELSAYQPEDLERVKRSIEQVKEERRLIEQSPAFVVVNNIPKLTPESVRQETGLTTGTKGDVHTSWLSKKGLTVDEAAHAIWEDFFAENNLLDTQEIKDIIIDALNYRTKKDWIDAQTTESVESLKQEQADKEINVPLKTDVTDEYVRDFMNKCFGL